MNELRDDLMRKIAELEDALKNQQKEIETAKQIYDQYDKTFDDLTADIEILKKEKCSQYDHEQLQNELRQLKESMGNGDFGSILQTNENRGARNASSSTVTEHDIKRWNTASEKIEYQEEKITRFIKELVDFEKVRENMKKVNEKLA